MSTRREFIKHTFAAGAATFVAENAPTASSRVQHTETQMKARRVPRTDLVISRVAYGTAGLALLDNNESRPEFTAKTTRAIDTAYNNGITFFDLADIYGGGQSEQALGTWLKQSGTGREKIVIQSKCGLRLPDNWKPGDPRPSAIGIDLSRKHILSAVDNSLKRLGTDHLDILLLHIPDPLLEPEEVAQAFDELRDRGKVRYFGVSNHTVTQIELLNRYLRQPLVVNQIALSLARYAPITERTSFGSIVDYCRLHDIQVQAFSPLKGGSVYDRPILLNSPADAPPKVREVAQLLSDIAKAHSVSPAAIMLAWLLRHPAGIVPIIGASKPEHIIDNCAADRVSLNREDWFTLLNAAAAIQSNTV